GSQGTTPIIPSFPPRTQNFLCKILQRPTVPGSFPIDYDLVPGPVYASLMQVIGRKVFGKYVAIYVPQWMNVMISFVLTLDAFGSALIKQNRVLILHDQDPLFQSFHADLRMDME